MAENDMLAMPVRDFSAAVAAKTPTPGGGSVAGVVGALGTALGEMALNFTRGKKKYAEHEALHAQVAHRLERARRMFQDLVADDVSAFRLYQEASAKEDSPQKAEAVQLAISAAAAVPREMTKLSLAVLADLLNLTDKCSPFLLSDLVAGAALSAATVRLCHYNILINAPQITDRSTAEELRKASGDDLARANGLLHAIEEATRYST
jgi:formiminotetrahydrofolate cyclodeaminase